MQSFRNAIVWVAGLATVILIIASILADHSVADGASVAEAVVDGSGNLHVPDDYRTTYQFLGTWAAAKDEGAGSEELHVVYASPGTIAAYRQDGQFPDGAVLVKEVYRAATSEMTTGTISHEDHLRGWFVMVRDRRGRHVESDVWGDGWGWSWFDAANHKTASRALPVKDGVPQPTFDYRENCKSCHSPAAGTEWIFTEGYPPLKR